MSTLPLRKASIVAKTLERAGTEMNAELCQALREYVVSMQITFQFNADCATSPAAYRKQVMLYLANQDERLAQKRAKLTEAIAAFDKDVEDYEVWMTAARAANRFRDAE